MGLICRTSNGFFAGDLDKFQNLLLVDSLRGEDSTGAYCVLNNRQVKTIKVASHPAHLFACEAWTKFRQAAISTGRIIIGHNRKATQGKVVSENAHPFVDNHIILVHNGTLRTRDGVGNEEVDSHAVCRAIAKDGAEKVLSAINGAFAFVWYDTKTSKLNIIRNDERPLSLIKTDSVYAIASEGWMATGVFSRDYGKVQEELSFKVGSLYSFSLDGSYTVTELKLKTVPVTKHHGPPYDDEWHEREYNARYRQPTSNIALLPFKSKETVVDVITKSQFDLVKGDVVDFNILTAEIPSGSDVRVKVKGKVLRPNKPPMDAIGFMDKNVDISEMAEWISGNVQGTVMSVNNSVCGPSAWVNNIKFKPYIKTHNGTILKTSWDNIVKNCECATCSAKVYDDEALFTDVKVKLDSSMWEVTCADCVMDKLTGDIKNEFQKDRNAAIQDALNKLEEISAIVTVSIADTNIASIH